MAKRKRQAVEATDSKASEALPNKKSKENETRKPNGAASPVETIQLVAGSYDQVLHGFTMAIDSKGEAHFADTFLFNAHKSAVRCVAVSPPSSSAGGQTPKVILASGSTDERINLYNLSAYPPSKKEAQQALSAVAPRPILENSKNRELGTLLHHESTVTALRFPTRSKLLSSSEDSSIAVTRTRDWSTLSTIKAPIPLAQGRPSGDTAALGATPSGVNDFAIHPSMKLMISVSKGERSMRLWNLVTGKKAGVLNFGRELLQEVGEGKHSTGEGRRVVWGSVDGADEFAVGFDRDIVVFGMDSVPKCRVMPTIRNKVHQFHYVPLDDDTGRSVLAVATEDGRIMFFSTREEDLNHASSEKEDIKNKSQPLPTAKLLGQIGGKEAGVTGRIKDFIVIRSEQDTGKIYLVGGSSDGKVRAWAVGADELRQTSKKTKNQASDSPPSLGKPLGTYETQNRITCMAGFLMIPRPEGAEESEDEFDDEDGEGFDGLSGSGDDESDSEDDEEA